MKKLLVLSVLLGLMALPMFAQITFGGDVTFGFISDFSGDNQGEKRDLTFDVKATIDDFNSLTINIDELETSLKYGGASAAAGVGVSKALVTTDLGKWLGLPVGLKVAWGYDDPDWNAFGDITTYGNTGIYLSPDEYWGIDVLLTWNMLEFELAMNPGAKNKAADLGYLLVGAAVKEPIPGLNAEFYYYQGADGPTASLIPLDTFDSGIIAIDAAYATEVADIALEAAPGFKYDMGAETWFWGFGVAASKDMFAVDLGAWGDDVDAFAGLDAVVKVSPIDKLDIYAGLVLSFVSGDDAFQGADLGVTLKAGKTAIDVGYLITSNAAGEINGYFAAADKPDGGFYVAFDVNY